MGVALALVAQAQRLRERHEVGHVLRGRHFQGVGVVSKVALPAGGQRRLRQSHQATGTRYCGHGFGTRNHAAGFMTGTEDGLIDPRRTVQIGIRGHMASLEMDDWARANFARVFTTDDVAQQGVAAILKQTREVIGDGPTYLSFDLDAIDPAYAPGVADPEINGLTIRETIQLLQGFRGLDLMGADIVCYAPPLDNAAQLTALTISSMLLELVTLIADYRSSQKGSAALQATQVN